MVYKVLDLNEDITIVLIETYKNGKGEIRFNSPNLTSLFMSASDKALTSAKEIYNQLIKPKQSIRERLVFTEIETGQLYDYLEYIQTAIITLYTAIESLANVLIPDDYMFTEEKNEKTIVWNKEKIERSKSTQEKIKKIIPDALKIISPTTLRCWTRFTEFEKLRNEIVHIKTSSLTNKEADKKIISKLINDSVFNKMNAGRELIKELAELIPHHYEYPILRNTETLIPIEVRTWSDTGFEKSD